MKLHVKKLDKHYDIFRPEIKQMFDELKPPFLIRSQTILTDCLHILNDLATKQEHKQVLMSK